MLVLFEDDESVRAWQGRMGASGRGALRTFRVFYREVLIKHERLVGLNPTQIVDWQVNARGRDAFLIKSLAQAWINRQRLTIKTKGTRLSHVSSFFLHNHAPLPADPSFHFTSDIPPVEGKLTVEAFQRILHSCNKMYKPVFLMMSQGLLDENGLVFINKEYCSLILENLTKNVGVFKLVLHGRKMNRNVKNYYVLLSTNSDWARAMKNYLKSLPEMPRRVLFKNKHGEPLTEKNIQYYFHWRAVETSTIRQFTPKCSRCRGETVRVRKKHPELEIIKVGYKCKECVNLDWACDLNLNLTNIRYGVNPHEIRDLMRSRWRASGAKTVVAEFMMGHEIDKNSYDKMKYTPSDAIMEYRKALKWLNILSHDPEKIKRVEIDERLNERDAEISVLRKALANQKQQYTLLESRVENKFDELDKRLKKWRKRLNK